MGSYCFRDVRPAMRRQTHKITKVLPSSSQLELKAMISGLKRQKKKYARKYVIYDK